MSQQLTQASAPVVGELLYVGAELGLREYVKCSWVYSKNFHLERCVETAQTLNVYGRSEIYRFEKSETSILTLNERWRRACAELSAIEHFAPGYCLGFQPYLLEEELFWLWDTPRTSDLDLPLEAHGFAAVFRRLPEASSLLKLLSAQPVSLRRLRQPIRQLRKIHQTGLPLNPADWRRILERRFGEKLLLLTQSFGSFLDPFSRVLICELQGFLRRYVAQNEARFVQRARAGQVRELHGDLRLSNILIDCDRTLFLEPLVNHDLRTVGDVLADLAALTLDARLAGFGTAAAVFEREYARSAGATFDPELYRFFQIEAALERACNLFAEFESIAEEDLIAEAVKILALGLRKLYLLDEAFIICVCGSEASTLQLSGSLSELSGARHLQAEDIYRALPNLPQERAFVFERLLQRVEQTVAQQQPVVLSWPSCNDFEYEQLLHAFAELKLPFLFVRADDHSKLSARTFEQGQHFLWVEDSLRQEELALFVIRELSKRLSSKL